MSAAVLTPPASLPNWFLRAGIRRFSVSEYDELTRTGVFGPKDRLELLEGYLVEKMGHNPPHANACFLMLEVVRPLLPAGWVVRGQSPVALSDSRPEPDAAVVRGSRGTYATRHPTPADFGVVVEVSDSSLAEDRDDMGRVYARSGLPVYWIVNIPERQVEVYTAPQPAADPPAYASRVDYKPGDAVPLTLDGVTVSVPVAELLP